MNRILFFAISLLSAGLASAAVDYSKDIKPLLATACVQCHGADQPKGDLRLDTAAGALKGGEKGKVVVAGKSADSLLVKLLQGAHDDLPQMPFKRNALSAEQVAVIKQWIDDGATAPAAEEPSKWAHWAFVKPAKAALPKISNLKSQISNPQTNPIDAFINARLAKESIEPSPRAELSTLIRRMSLDLTGLPPSPEQVEAFTLAASKDPQAAIATAADELLSRPAYGERWGRWWLDQARYADSNGYSIDAPRSMWPYRDWVVKALNANLHFDEFTIQQLAGDLLDKPTVDQLIATGFHRNTQVNGEGGIDPEQFRIESIFDRVGTTGSVWLGLTIGCCQCHDHKFDPLPQKDYYRMFAFFNNAEQDGHGNTKTSTVEIPDAKRDTAALNKEKKELEAKLAVLMPPRLKELANWEATLTRETKKKIRPEVVKIVMLPAAKRKPAQVRELYSYSFGFNDPEFKGVNDRLLEVEHDLANKVTSLSMKELPEKRETHLFIKGDFTRPADIVTAGTPGILPPMKDETGKTNRLDLARWIVSKDNPLTARVIVNRIWLQYFGKGIVETESDFGTQGSLPSHPELLDWLAVDFMEHGWDLKHLHKLIVTSETYQRSSKARPDLALKDPYNKLLAHQTRLRMDAEMVRDVCLKVTGLLSPKIGGPPVYPPQPEGAMNLGQVKHPWPVSKGEDRYRRALYTFFFRASPHPALTVFDAPDAFTTCTRRIRSNTPLQALTLLNDSAFFEFAQALEKIVKAEGAALSFERCTGRKPSAMELERLSKLDALTTARVLLNLDETITRE
jgi:Protein of unknown function (DUF1553)/Protein of unknown function (DUF1549)/Planctomycete cytochrome C